MPFDTTSLGRDYLHEVVLIQGQAPIADVGSRLLISRSHYEPTPLHQICQWEHTLINPTPLTKNYDTIINIYLSPKEAKLDQNQFFLNKITHFSHIVTPYISVIKSFITPHYFGF